MADLNLSDNMHQLHLHAENDPGFDSGGGEDEPDALLGDALVHILLPKQTPGQSQPNLEEIEQFLLQTFTKSIQVILSEFPTPHLEPVKTMLEKWETLQPTSWNIAEFLEAFPMEIASLQNGVTIPIYVRNQNSALLITKYGDEYQESRITLSTFQCSLPSQLAMSNVEKELCLELPETKETIQNIDMLASLPFAKLLHELSAREMDISKGTSLKGGSEFTETRDVADPKLVSDWIIGLLVPSEENSELQRRSDLKIQKKFKDQVSLNEAIGSSQSLPFRRSGMYMALKGAVQLKLLETMEPGEQDAELVYKIVMLGILSGVARQFPVNDMIGVDLATQLLAKLGRRVQKLVKLCSEKRLPIPNWVMTFKTKCLEHVVSTVDRLTSKMKILWDHVTKQDHHQQDPIIPISLPSKHAPEDFHHQIPKLDQFLQDLKTDSSSSSLTRTKNQINNSEVFERYPTFNSIMDPGVISRISNSSVMSVFVWLNDTENFIKYHCTTQNTEPSMISQLFTVYHSNAKIRYSNDPLGQSQLYLVSLKVLGILDSITTEAIPLLLNYKPEVNVKLFDHLLLPYKKDMNLLDKLLAYFRDRERNAHIPGILSSRLVDWSTFSVQYARQSEEMISLRNKILQDTEVAIQRKYVEIEQAIKNCKKLERQINVFGPCVCTYDTRTSFKGSKQQSERYKITCEKCKLQECLQSRRKSITRYERPLPPQDVLQWAVIFELATPPKFAIFRDYLAKVKYMLWGDKVFNGEKSNVKQHWREYRKISSYITLTSGNNIKIGSTSMPASATSLTKTAPLDVLINRRESYAINNGMGCTYCFTGSQRPSNPTIQSDCAFKLGATSNHERYSESNLQITLESTQHTQNNILARQNECHQKLAVDEFITFGSLRAGHRIQLRNLFEAIYTGSMSLEKEPVLALVLQTIWQLGPQNEKSERECHLDFFSGEDSCFAEEFLDMLNKLVKTNEANYSNPLIMLMAVAVTKRISDLNRLLQEKCYDLLKSWRRIMSKWTAKLEAALDKPEVASIHGEVASLRKNLMEIVISSMLSYSIADCTQVPLVMKDQEDVLHWLQSLFQWNQLKNPHVPTSLFFKLVQNFVKIIPLRMQLENYIDSEDSLIVDTFKTFISQKWNKARECTLKSISIPFKSKNKDSLVLVEYLDSTEGVTHQITFDFIRGAFLVNGFCRSTLPVEVKDHKLFQMYFKDAANLIIQRDHANLTRTIVPFHGRHYEFHQKCIRKASLSPFPSWNRGVCDEPELIIKEIPKEVPTNINPASKLILLDPEIFLSGVLANYFIENYTHWLDTTNECIHFRPTSNPKNDHTHHYTLQRMTTSEHVVWKLCDVLAGGQVLAVHSAGFQQITQVLERLELDRYVNVTHLHEKLTTTATLRRYNLRFTLDQNYECQYLESVEYPGYLVSSDQSSLGTLIGLEQGLLMENGERRLILVPHSSIKYHNDGPGTFHQSCSIILSENLRQPPCFVYEVDDVLKRLKAHNSKSAWLYLAALHAVTSSPFFPDPFTEVTGTEMAIQILQSACVWSCSPYDKESLEALNFIQTLSPSRKWYGDMAPNQKLAEKKRTMETTMWPPGLPTVVAYDGFAIIVKKLIEDSEKLAALHGNQQITNDQNDPVEEGSEERLCLRGYFRSLSMYNSTADLQSHSHFTESQLDLIQKAEETSLNQSFTLRVSSQNFNISNLQSISFVSLTDTMEPLKNSDIFKQNNLVWFILTSEPLDSDSPKISLDHSGGFQDLLSLDFRFNWLRLYSMATSCRTLEDVHLFGIILSAAAYRGAPLEQVANLYCISVISREGITDLPAVPSNSGYSSPSSNDYEIETVGNILKENAKPFTALQVPSAPVELSPAQYRTCSLEDLTKAREQYGKAQEKYVNDLEEYNIQKAAYEQEIQESCAELSRYFELKFWPCESISLESVGMMLECLNFCSTKVVNEMNEMLAFWYSNYKLTLFAAKVQEQLNLVWDYVERLEGEMETPSFISLTLHQKCSPIHLKIGGSNVSLETLESYLDVDVLKAKRWIEVSNIFKSGRGNWPENNRDLRLAPPSEDLEKKVEEDFWLQRESCKDAAKKVKEDLLKMLTSTIPSQILCLTGIAPRLSPLCILKTLTIYYDKSEWKRAPDEKRIAFVYSGAIGVLWSHLKRLNRCLRAKSEVDFQRELDNPGHVDWSPKENPEWLLLELELDIMIRPIQVKVAKQMIHMPNGGNGVTQLNMGEGKTSVIVPMLCATLGKGGEQVCRVTVLSSMFKMNLSSLTFSIGGLLNKRVYWMPCRRDMEVDLNCLRRIFDGYQECRNKGVILTLPEYRLSFRLLAYDKMYKKEWQLGEKMLIIENFLRYYVRDVLDESDELFNVKYQLVYTIGAQVPVDGGQLRWFICQKILAVVQNVAPKLLENYGTGMVEFQEQQRPHEFATFRLLGNENCLKEFRELVADAVLADVMISETEKRVVKKFLIQDQIEEDEHLQVLKSIFREDNPDMLNQILLISGYLRRGVLGLALTKRWRVEYGVNSKPNFPRLMAIPFRAKDVAAEKTEFGHPDLAIVLTHLSYYYSGLSNNQLEEVFEILKGKKEPEAIYSRWISRIPEKYLPDSLERYFSLNMKDFNQKILLFEMLRKHKMVIDFWLSHCVLPRESKQFPGKLVMTAWDLCYERQRFPVTGFSGTNDSQILLPLMISQQDLEELQSTNENMERTLLQPENGINHKGFPMGVTCKHILDSMKQDNLTVLIDAGALMLECSNEQVANLWLKVDQAIEAAVYFSENGELLVKTRGDPKFQDTPFEVSSYQDRLDKCGVFLDDQHTRGTDLKFPVGPKACVTVATRMKRDKLIQACMRMRKLGHGHSVTFYLSHEAHGKIGGGEITTEGVLKWVCQNTRESNQDGLLYWALAGRNYAQRLIAEDLFHFPSNLVPYLKNWDDDGALTITKMNILASQCVDDEVIKLVDLYGQYTQVELLTKLISKWFGLTRHKLHQKDGCKPYNMAIYSRLLQIRDAIKQKCLAHVPNKLHMSSDTGDMMEEEQEKELELEKEIELEVEEERQVERPRKVNEAWHLLHEKVIQFAKWGGQLQADNDCFVRLCQVLESTTFWGEVQPECWYGRVYATKDFISTIDRIDAKHYKTDAYLRPIRYLISFMPLDDESPIQLLAVSPFEANELLPIFRSSRTTVCKMHMFSARRSEKQDLLLNNIRLQLPLSTEDESTSKNIVAVNSENMMSLLLASGSLFFVSRQEQWSFAKYLGLFPQPWSEKEREAFSQGCITKSGFLLRQFRASAYQAFEKDPSGLVKKILMCRYSAVSEVTHVMRLLDEKRFVELK